MRQLILPALLAALILTGAARAAPAAHLQLVDLTPAFAAAWEHTKDLPDDARVAAFDAEMAPRLPGFYDAARYESAASRARKSAAAALSPVEKKPASSGSEAS